MQDCGITGVYLSEKTDISTSGISKFLQGHSEMKSGNIEKLIEALPQKAQVYYFNLLCPRTNDIKLFLDEASQEEKAEVLHMVAESLEKPLSPKNPPKAVVAKTREVVPV